MGVTAGGGAGAGNSASSGIGAAGGSAGGTGVAIAIWRGARRGCPIGRAGELRSAPAASSPIACRPRSTIRTAAPPMPALANNAAMTTTGRSAKERRRSRGAGADSERRKRPRIRWRDTSESAGVVNHGGDAQQILLGRQIAQPRHLLEWRYSHLRFQLHRHRRGKSAFASSRSNRARPRCSRTHTVPRLRPRRSASSWPPRPSSS